MNIYDIAHHIRDLLGSLSPDAPHALLTSSAGLELSEFLHSVSFFRCCFTPLTPTSQKDEQAAEQLGDTLKQVMEGVKSQAGHIRGTVAQLEDERDKAIRGKDTATKELEVGLQL